MSDSNEHKDMKADRPLDKSVDRTNATSRNDESTLSDLLHVLGIKKKKRDANKAHHASQIPADIPVSAGLPDGLDSAEPTSPTASESLVNADAGLVEEEASDLPAENSVSVATVVFPDLSTLVRKKLKTRKITWIVAAVLIVAVAVYFALPYLTEPIPPSEDVVASYSGRNVTIEELKSFIALEQAKEMEHAYCDKHGYDRTKWTPDEKCESHLIHGLDGYRQMTISLPWSRSCRIGRPHRESHSVRTFSMALSPIPTGRPVLSS